MRSLWTDPQKQTYPTLESEVEADVVIVGCGLSGAGAACALSNRGLRVVILEERTVASGASGRNAGFVLAGPAMIYSEAVGVLGTEAARLVWTFTEENNTAMATLIEDLGIDCGYLRRGSMSLAISEREMELLEIAQHNLEQAGISTCTVSAPGLPQPFDRMYCGGLYYPGNAELNPAAFVQGVTRHIAAEMVVYERSPVRSLQRRSTWVVRTERGVVHAGLVLLATNAYTGRLLPNAPIAPTRGQVLATDPLPNVVVPFPMYANYGYQYWRQTPEGRLVVGGWRDRDTDAERGDQEWLHDDIQSSLEWFASKIAGHEAVIAFRWAGIMGFTPDMMPLVGRVPGRDGLFMAAGYSGHGVAMAFTCGWRTALCAIGEDVNVPSCFDPARFPGIAAEA